MVTSMVMTRSARDTDEILGFCHEASRLLADRRCDDIRLLDVRGISQVCDFMLIASGTSDRQMKSLAAELHDLARDHGVALYRKAVDLGTTWVAIDFIDLVVHLFEPNLRAYYDLESLWSDGDPLDWRREDQKDAHRFEGAIGLGYLDRDDDGDAPSAIDLTRHTDHAP